MANEFIVPKILRQCCRNIFH